MTLNSTLKVCVWHRLGSIAFSMQIFLEVLNLPLLEIHTAVLSSSATYSLFNKSFVNDFVTTAPVQHGSKRHLMTTNDVSDIFVHATAEKMTSEHRLRCLVFSSVTKTSLLLPLSSLLLDKTMKFLLLKETAFEHLGFFFFPWQNFALSFYYLFP